MMKLPRLEEGWDTALFLLAPLHMTPAAIHPVAFCLSRKDGV